MPHGLIRGDAGYRTAPGRLDRGGDRAHLFLDRSQSDHRVELGHGVLDRDLRPGLRQAGSAALMVTRGVIGVGQRGGLGPGAVARLVRRMRTWPGVRRPRLSGRRRFRPASRIHPGVLRSLRQPPADDGEGDENGRDHPDKRLMRPDPQQYDADRQRPEHRPRRGAARQVPAGQRSRPGHPGHDEGKDEQRKHMQPGHLGEQVDRDAPGGDRERRPAPGPLLDHVDGRAAQGVQQEER